VKLLKYHYPSCLNITYGLSPEEIDNIKNNEFEFIKSKLPSGYSLYQIPRVIYDLFTILFTDLDELNPINLDWMAHFNYIQY